MNAQRRGGIKLSYLNGLYTLPPGNTTGSMYYKNTGYRSVKRKELHFLLLSVLRNWKN